MSLTQKCIFVTSITGSFPKSFLSCKGQGTSSAACVFFEVLWKRMSSPSFSSALSACHLSTDESSKHPPQVLLSSFPWLGRHAVALSSIGEKVYKTWFGLGLSFAFEWIFFDVQVSLFSYRVTVSIPNGLYSTQLDDFINYNEFIHNKFCLYSMPVVAQVLLWLLGFCEDHMKIFMRHVTSLVFRMPWVNLCEFLLFSVTAQSLCLCWSWVAHPVVIWGTCPVCMPAVRVIYLVTYLYAKVQLLAWNRSTEGVMGWFTMFSFTCSAFSEDETGLCVGLWYCDGLSLGQDRVDKYSGRYLGLSWLGTNVFAVVHWEKHNHSSTPLFCQGSCHVMGISAAGASALSSSSGKEGKDAALWFQQGCGKSFSDQLVKEIGGERSSTQADWNCSRWGELLWLCVWSLSLPPLLRSQEGSGRMWSQHYIKPVRRHSGNLRWINLRCKV